MHATTTLNTDLLTPLGAYLRVRGMGRASFLLESVERGRLGRSSWMGAGSRLVDLAEAEELDLPVVGYVAYDHAAALEPTVPLPEAGPDLPVSRLVVCDTLVRFDHGSGTAEVLAGDPDELAGRLAAGIPWQKETRGVAGPLSRSPDRSGYEEMVRAVKRHIVAGDVFQCVPSQRAERPTSASPLDVYRALRRVNPSPYLFLLDLDGLALVGSSPERLVACEDGRASLCPIAGTTDPTEGDVERLLTSEKDRAEHVMLSDAPNPDDDPADLGPASTYPATPKNLAIAAPDRAALLAAANAWKRDHQDSWSATGDFSSKQLGGPVSGGVYFAGWLGHEYAYANFALDGWEFENSLLFVRAVEHDDWQVLRHDIATDVGAVCALPTPLAQLWYADIARSNGCAPLADSSRKLEAGELERQPRLVASADLTVTCLLEAKGPTASVSCLRDGARSGMRLAAAAADPIADPRSSQQFSDTLYDADGGALGTTLGLDDELVVTGADDATLLTCSSPAGTAIECTNGAGGRLRVDGGV